MNVGLAVGVEFTDPSRFRRPFQIPDAMPPRNFYTILLALLVAQICYVKAEVSRDSAPLGAAIGYIDRYYVEEVDKRDLLEAALAGLQDKLDPYSQYIPPAAYEQFQDSIQQEFAGIGALVEQPEEDDPARIITPLAGSPALAAGLLPGDEIIAVGEIDTRGKKLSEVVKLLRGPIGSVIRMRIRRDTGEGQEAVERVVEVTRGNILLESVLGARRDANNRWVYRLEGHPQIAYIRLTGFGERTSADFRRVLKDLDNRFDGLILDLRGNAGGLLTSSVEICDMFLDRGRIVSTRGRGVLQSEAADGTDVENAAWDASKGTLVDAAKPVAVLIDGNSASAAEIVAACLQDHQRATVVGERSFGKGSVQNVFPLESGRSALKLTTARYYGPNGRNIHRGPDDSEEDPWGVQPDPGFVVKLDDETRQQVMERWEVATYPRFAESVDAPEADAGDWAETDPQLWRAIEAVRGDASRDTPAERPGEEQPGAGPAVDAAA